MPGNNTVRTNYRALANKTPEEVAEYSEKYNYPYVLDTFIAAVSALSIATCGRTKDPRTSYVCSRINSIVEISNDAIATCLAYCNSSSFEDTAISKPEPAPQVVSQPENTNKFEDSKVFKTEENMKEVPTYAAENSKKKSNKSDGRSNHAYETSKGTETWNHGANI